MLRHTSREQPLSRARRRRFAVQVTRPWVPDEPLNHPLGWWGARHRSAAIPRGQGGLPLVATCSDPTGTGAQADRWLPVNAATMPATIPSNVATISTGSLAHEPGVADVSAAGHDRGRAAVAPIVSRVIPGRPPQVLFLILGGILVGPNVCQHR